MTDKRAFRQNWRNAGTQFEHRNAGSYDIGHWQRRKIDVYEARPLWVLSSRNLNLDNVIKKYRSFKCALIQWCKELEHLRTSKALTLAWKLKLLIGVLLWIWFSSRNLTGTFIALLRTGFLSLFPSPPWEKKSCPGIRRRHFIVHWD